MSYAAYDPSGGNNNDVQYKSGVGLLGSDGFVVNGSNVGIGSVTPGQALDVKGTVRVTGFLLNSSPVNGYVLTSDNSGNGTWGSQGVANYWLNTTAMGNVGISTMNTVGIGTTSGGAGAGLIVMNGNVGIGTWAPADMFQVGAYNTSSGGFEVDSNGNVGLGTTLTANSVLSVMSGNVGIGTWVPGAALQVGNNTFDVNTILGNVGIDTYNPQKTLEIAPLSNAVASMGLLSTGGAGTDINLGTGGSYTGAGSNYAGIIGFNQEVGGAVEFRTAFNAYPTPVNAFKYTRMIITTDGNIGIYTISPSSSLAVLGSMGVGSTAYASTYSAPSGGLIVQGNVGVGTWVASDTFQVGTYSSVVSGFEVDSNGNVGIATTITSNAALSVMVGNVGIGTWVPRKPFQVGNFISSSGGLEIDSAGNVGMGTTLTGNAALSVLDGNMGIGTWVAGASLDLNRQTDAVILPSGTTAQEPSTPINGMIRYNNTIPWVESYQNSGWKPVNGQVVLCNSGAASATVTSSTETNLAACTIPAGAMGTAGKLAIYAFYKFVGTANKKYTYIRFSTTSGDTSVGTLYEEYETVLATYLQIGEYVTITNVNSASSQIGGDAANAYPNEGLVGVTTSAINTANASYVNFNCACVNNSTDTCQLVGYTVVLLQQM